MSHLIVTSDTIYIIFFSGNKMGSKNGETISLQLVEDTKSGSYKYAFSLYIKHKDNQANI